MILRTPRSTNIFPPLVFHPERGRPALGHRGANSEQLRESPSDRSWVRHVETSGEYRVDVRNMFARLEVFLIEGVL